MCAKANPSLRRISTRRQAKSAVRSSDDVVETCLPFLNWSSIWYFAATGMG